ncbi:uncharacterized protein LOC116419360 isoform X2 [Sarcophilus harrisii]|uniref:uncharacterized protein LOC116419360 isoform X2 n=1 Tax=Sarcophilus harrisii TaxID=9305 RepID=UPI001301A097|nr:uncharacterized protein LOC116419360 isoform X2 [Sarcophilus harrisii]
MAWEPGAGPAAAASGSTTSGTPLLGGFRTDCSVDWLAPPLHHESSPRVPPHVAHAGWSGSMSKRTDRGPGGHFPASYPTRDVASSLALRGVPCASCPWTRRQEGPLEREGKGPRKEDCARRRRRREDGGGGGRMEAAAGGRKLQGPGKGSHDRFPSKRGPSRRGERRRMREEAGLGAALARPPGPPERSRSRQKVKDFGSGPSCTKGLATKRKLQPPLQRPPRRSAPLDSPVGQPDWTARRRGSVRHGPPFCVRGPMEHPAL